MKTKLFTLSLALTMSIGTMYAQFFSVGYLGYAGNEDTKTATVWNTIQNFDKVVTSIDIPDSVEYNGEYYRVTAINPKVFYLCSKLTSVTIGSNVERIGKDAFYSCSGLTSLVLPNSVVTIEEEAFFKCSGLTSVMMGHNVKSIGKQAFRDCSQISSLNIPNSVVRIGEAAFQNCRCLTAVTIPDGVDSIGKGAFAVCTKLASVAIGRNIEYIGDLAFSACYDLKEVTCMALNPPPLYSFNDGYPFSNVSTASLYVPTESVAAYKSAKIWKEFNSILPIAAEQTEDATNTIEVEPYEYSVKVTWPYVSSATTYELIIKDKTNDFSRTFTFDAQGLLTSMASHAPARNNAPRQKKQSGYTFTITGLENAMTYDLTIIVKNTSGGTLQTKTISFTTGRSGGKEENDISSCTEAAEAALSVSANNVLYNNGKVYTIEGYVTAIAAAWSSKYKDISFWMADTQNGGKVIEAFRAVCTEQSNAPRLGDHVRVTGALTKYGSTPEFAAGCTFEIISDIEPSSHGVFTICDNMQVRFAPGNLQYQPSTNTWRFAEHQYDVTHLSAGDINYSGEYEGWIDEFSWDYGDGRGQDEFNWGQYSIINGGNKPDAWFTLAYCDWHEIFNYRENAENLWGCGTVNGIDGIIILPDNWVLPQGLIFNAGVKKGLAPYDYPDDGSAVPSWYDGGIPGTYYYNPNRDNFKHNTYSIGDWQRMANAGAIFLPRGGYWTCSAYDGNATSAAWCGDDFLKVSAPYDLRENVHFVRLVQDINYTDDLEVTTEDVPINAKVIHDGQIYILRGEKIYTLQGQEVK